MKRILPLLTALLIAVSGSAQSTPQLPDTYLPFHEYLQKHNADIQRQGFAGHGNSRSVVYNEIAFRGDSWDTPSSSWTGSDSGVLTYNAQAYETNGLYDIASGGSWFYASQNSYTYDGNGDELTDTVQNWIPYQNNWRNNSLTTYTYANDNFTQQLDQTWDTLANTWDNYSQNTFTYNGNHQQLSYLTQTWLSGSWTNSSQTLNTYDSNGNELTSTTQSWVSGAWVNNQLSQNTYNASNEMTTQVTQNWSGNAWVNYSQYTYTYNNNGNNTGYIVQAWNGGQWSDASQIIYTYTAANLLATNIYQTWNGTAWVNYGETIYTYDANNNKTNQANFLWVSSAWQPLDNYAFTFDSNNNNITELQTEYNTSTLTFGNYSRYFYYYLAFNVSGTSDMKNELGAVVFPNPSAAANIHVSLDLNQGSVIMLAVYDAQGRIINTQTHPVSGGTNDLNIGIAGMAAGNYFIRMMDRNSGKTSVLKFMKQ